MAGELDGQVAIVTGGGRGFGAAIAERLASAGASVCITARSKGPLDEIAAGIAAIGGKALAVAGDVTNRTDVARVVQLTEAAFGPVTLFINNAGVPGPFGPIWSTDPDDWWESEQIHIRAPVLFMHAVVPGMLIRGSGRVIIVAAIASRLLAPNLSAYCIGKTAQVRLIEQAAAESKGTGVNFFAIDPGFVITRLAHDTMNSPDAQRWLPEMVNRLKARAEAADPPNDLYRCAERCAALASGRYDGLSGKYMELTDDLDAMVAGLTDG